MKFLPIALVLELPDRPFFHWRGCDSNSLSARVEPRRLIWTRLRTWSTTTAPRGLGLTNPHVQVTAKARHEASDEK
jgi:hypothetical protein